MSSASYAYNASYSLRDNHPMIKRVTELRETGIAFRDAMRMWKDEQTEASKYAMPGQEGKMNLKDMIKEFEDVQRQLEAKRARRAPDANKTTKVMRAPMTYRYWLAGENKRGHDVKFCVSDYVNVAGYVLIWKQTEGWSRKKWVVKRSHWCARKTGAAAETLAKRRCKAASRKLRPSSMWEEGMSGHGGGW